jgi:Uma2 family endonuclease
MSTVQAPARSQSLVLSGIDWQTYSRLLWAFAVHRSIRLTYDRGKLEIMSPLLVHDKGAEFLGRLIVTLTEELGMTLLAGGSVTLRHRKLLRGLEPDRCYWIAHEPQVRGKDRLDLRKDPPPDLALEVDITRSALNRMGIYAALSVPELWRLDGATLTFHSLGTNRRYAPVTHSPTFPFVAPADLMGFLALRANQDDNAVAGQFRAWVRRQIAAAGGMTTP